ncbi:MAG: hypothetical protein HND48_11435 [Chloroflexi bacterium]|nr:hypothetical protein [Chloroflexota bacterium]
MSKPPLYASIAFLMPLSFMPMSPENQKTPNITVRGLCDLIKWLVAT